MAYLAVEADRPHRRETLTALLYPEQTQTQAQNNLRKTLHRLRAALRQTDESGSLLITPKTLQFNPAASHVLDVEVFRAHLAPTRRHLHRRAETCVLCARAREEALASYRGEFLAGFHLSNNDMFQEWVTLTREQLHQHALEAFMQTLHFYLNRVEWEPVMRYARRALELEPWNEIAHRALMTAFAAQGQRAAAFAQYEACKKILAAQLDAEPERETRELYQAIRAGNFTLPTPPASNLQAPLTPFIGRAHEIELLTARLLDPTRRLHTIVGPGGMGKTRLALAVAERARGDFRDGVFFVALATVPPDTAHLPDAIASATADALNLPFSGSSAPSAQLFSALRQKELLLVLDNLEHLPAAADWIVELLRRAPQLTVLATTREPLNVSAETLLRLDGLSVPEAEGAIELRASESVQLFVERAARAAGHFTVTPETLRVVANICRRVHGMPLAIELAAAWQRTRTLTEIAQQLETDLDTLDTMQRDVPERHRSLRAVWEGSWNLLNETQQLLLAQASIFRNGFSQEAAKQIINVQVSDLDRLIDKSILKRSDNGRYEIHELLIRLVREKISKTDNKHQIKSKYININQEELKNKHSAYYIDFVSKRGALLFQGDPRGSLAEIRPELDNFRAAWNSAIEMGNVEAIARGLEGIFNFYYLTGLYREGLALLTQALALAESSASNELYLRLLLARAEFLERLAQYAAAQHELNALLPRLASQPELLTRAHLRAAWIGYWTGQLDAGRSHIRIILSDTEMNSALHADALYVAGLIEQSAANLTGAREFYERALARYRAQENQYGESSALVNLADIGVDGAALDDALRYGEQALTLSTRIGKRFDQAAANVILGSLYFTLGDFGRAETAYAQALAIFRDLGNSTGESIALRGAASLQLQRGDARAALASAEHAAQLALELHSPYREGMARILIGDSQLALHLTDQAEQSYMRALELLQHAERGHRALDAWAGLVRVALARGDAAQALHFTNEILARFDAQTFYDCDDPSALYVLCVRVLAAQHDPRAQAVAARGNAELMQRAAQIQDNALRHYFLERPASHRALRALWTQFTVSETSEGWTPQLYIQK